MLTQEKLKALFDYSPLTGKLTRKVVTANRVKVGEIAGTINGSGYLQTSVQSKTYFNHRLIWLWHYGYLPEHQIDHIDRVRSNNKLNNLRETNSTCNLRNRTIPKNNASGVAGVSWSEKRKYWDPSIGLDSKTCHLGISTDFIEAVAHRLAAEQCLDWGICAKKSSAKTCIDRYVRRDK